MSRTLAREDAFKMIFEMRITGSQPETVLEYLCETASADNEMWAQRTVTRENFEYIQAVVSGVEENVEKINAAISPKLKKWSIDRISKVDLAILQLAVFEIMYIEDIPEKVSVNEAVNLAKKYGENASPSFINGVLGSIISTK